MKRAVLIRKKAASSNEERPYGFALYGWAYSRITCIKFLAKKHKQKKPAKQ
jgi:hypothetical protein